MITYDRDALVKWIIESKTMYKSLEASTCKKIKESIKNKGLAAKEDELAKFYWKGRLDTLEEILQSLFLEKKNGV